jgi:dihydrofolate reductase
MRISLIAAMAENGVIGRDGQLPWHLAADLKRFKRLTMNHTLIMGRKTWESIGRPLPGRRMIVITRQVNFPAEGATVAASLEEAITLARQTSDDEAFVIGGAEIYRLALPIADRMYLTQVQAQVEGDATFPEFDAGRWRLVESEQHSANETNDYPICCERYERV